MDLLFRHERIRPSQFELVKDMYEAISQGKNFLCHAPMGLGKCIAGDSLVFTTSGLIEAKDLAIAKVNCIEPDNKKIQVKTGIKVKIGKENLIKIKTRHNYEIKGTKSHKFLTPEGWKRAEELKRGDKIATVRKMKIQIKKPKDYRYRSEYRINKKIKIKMTKNIAYLIGAFIGDGSFNSNIRIRFTIKNQEIVKRIYQAISEIGLELKKYKEDNYHVDSIVLKKFIEEYGSPDIRNGRKGGKCGAVYIPNAIITAPEIIFSHCIRGLFDTDGYVEKAGLVCLTSKSEKLIKTLRFSLLRFGIICQIGEKIDRKYGKYYILRITERESLIKFNKKIGFEVSYKAERLGKIIERITKTENNPNIDTYRLDKDFLLEIREKIEWKNKLYDSLCDYIQRKKDATKPTIKRLIKYLGKKGESKLVQKLEQIINTDILWDQILEIESLPEDDIYDFSVPQAKNFIAEGFVAHNSDASLSAAITHALKEDLNVFFLTPKISQHKIAMEVVNGIASKYKIEKLRAVDLVGRSHCCIDENLRELDSESFHTSCTKKRRDEQCLYYSNARGHNKFDEIKAESRFRVVVEKYGSGKSHHEIIKEGMRKQCCPYEWLLKLSEMSNVIIADYYHLMIPQIRDVFLMKIKKRIEDSIVIIDEAHNLNSRVRSSLSSTVSNLTFARMEKEMRYLGLDSGPVEEEFIKWARKTISDEDEILLYEKDLDVFFDNFGLRLEEVRDKLEESGEAFVDKTNKKSACLKIAGFLHSWREKKSECARVLKKKGPKFIISKKMLDPTSATNVLNQTYSSVLMSGTFEPLMMHLDTLGLDPFRSVMKKYKSPFNPKNTVNLITPNITSKYTKRNEHEFRKIAIKIDEISKVTPGGVALFFCSYNMMENVLPLLQKISRKKLHVQQRGMKPEEVRKLIKDFKNGGILCAVQGGSLSEGVDFSEGEIKSAVIIGVALEELDVVTKALIEYYDEKFGKGWDYGYLYPSLMKAMQSAGRARRKEEDRAAIVFMDERFRWGKYNWILNKEEERKETTDPEKEIEKFFKDQK